MWTSCRILKSLFTFCVLIGLKRKTNCSAIFVMKSSKLFQMPCPNNLKVHCPFICLFYVSECESLVRKMLVRDPAKRYTIKMVRKHVWMQADVKAAQSAKNYTKPTMKASTVINRTVVDPKSNEEQVPIK